VPSAGGVRPLERNGMGRMDKQALRAATLPRTHRHHLRATRAARPTALAVGSGWERSNANFIPRLPWACPMCSKAAWGRKSAWGEAGLLLLLRDGGSTSLACRGGGDLLRCTFTPPPARRTTTTAVTHAAPALRWAPSADARLRCRTALGFIMALPL